MRTRRLVSLMIALVAASIWVLATFSNASNDWDPVNFVLRVAAGTLTVAAGAEWFVLSIRMIKDESARAEGILPDDIRADEVKTDDAWADEVKTDDAWADYSGTDDAWAGDARPDGSRTAEPWTDDSSPDDVRRDVRAEDDRAGAAHAGASRGAGSARRSAGSRTVRDKLLRMFGRRRTPAQDLVVVANGGTVVVVAYLMERKVRRVTLRLGLDQASVDSLESELGAAPHRVFSTQAPTRGLFVRSAYTQIEGASSSGAWSIAVPTHDVQTFNYVLARAQEIR